MGFFEQRAKFVGESGLADAVRADECEFQNCSWVTSHFVSNTVSPVMRIELANTQVVFDAGRE
jgi:hypothetical protein